MQCADLKRPCILKKMFCLSQSQTKFLLIDECKADPCSSCLFSVWSQMSMKWPTFKQFYVWFHWLGHIKDFNWESRNNIPLLSAWNLATIQAQVLRAHIGSLRRTVQYITWRDMQLRWQHYNMVPAPPMHPVTATRRITKVVIPGLETVTIIIYILTPCPWINDLTRTHHSLDSRLLHCWYGPSSASTIRHRLHLHFPWCGSAMRNSDLSFWQTNTSLLNTQSLHLNSKQTVSPSAKPAPLLMRDVLKDTHEKAVHKRNSDQLRTRTNL